MRKLFFGTLMLWFTLLFFVTSGISSPVLAQTNEPTLIITEEPIEETPTPENDQEEKPTPISESPTPEPTKEEPTPIPAPTPEPTAIHDSFITIFSISLVFGIVSLLIVIFYFNISQTKFFKISESKSSQGRDVSPLVVNSFEIPSDSRHLSTNLKNVAPQDKLNLIGNTEIEVGITAKYSIEPVVENQTFTDRYAWRIIENKDASQNVFVKVSDDTHAATIIADKEGSFKLAISKENQTPPLISLPISAIPKRTPSNNPLQIPFIGQGYGTVIITILLISAVIALGSVKVLSGEGVATILGAIAGYVFGVGRKDNDPPSATTSSGEDQ